MKEDSQKTLVIVCGIIVILILAAYAYFLNHVQTRPGSKDSTVIIQQMPFTRVECDTIKATVFSSIKHINHAD